MKKECKVFPRILGYQVGMRVRFKGWEHKVWMTGSIWSIPSDRKGMYLICRDDKKPYNLFPRQEWEFELIGERKMEVVEVSR